MEKQHFHFEREKYKALVHLICSRVENPRRLSKTKLHKALLYTDLQFYLKHRRPVTGETYVKDEFGPVSVHLDEVVADLVSDGLIRTHQIEDYSAAIGQYHQNQYISIRPPDTDLFEDEELRIVNTVVDRIKQLKSKEISDFSHTAAYEAADYGEELPYFTIFSHYMRQPNNKEIDSAISVLKERQNEDVD